MKKLLAGIATLFLVSGCGGGGGGGEYVGAAVISLDASPTTIDPGDRTQLTIHIAEVDENGIIVKVRFPTSLKYVNDSSTLEVDGDDPFTISASKLEKADDFRYVVYFLSKSRFGKNAQGTLRLQVEGVSEDEEAIIGVDADVDDPRINNSVEFDVNNPEYSAEDEEQIRIKD